MHCRFLLGLLLLASWIGAQAGKLQAQSQAPPLPPLGTDTVIVINPPQPTLLTLTAVPVPEGVPPLPPKPFHPICAWLKSHPPCGCAAADVGCSNLGSETIFFWGSCRQFFGEPCVKGPPHSLLHPFAAKHAEPPCGYRSKNLRPAPYVLLP